MKSDLNEGDLYDITLKNGEEMDGVTLYDVGEGTITVGYDGYEEDPTLPPESVGMRRIILLSDVEEITPVG